ncbi:hypothetical protein [Rubrobacter naiadicus]|nr:hypothetical protein [Rubrobacter naiadicus]
MVVEQGPFVVRSLLFIFGGLRAGEPAARSLRESRCWPGPD